MTNKEKNFISAVVYIHNNAETIGPFLRRLMHLFYENFERYEIVCVNDASTDQSVQAVRELGKEFDSCEISIINMSYYQGLETAMNAGVDLAIGDFVYEFDTCLVDYDDEVIMDVYWHSLKGYDIVSASNSKKKLSSRLFYALYNKSAGAQYKITSETFRILSRRSINRIHTMSKTIPYRKALYSNSGLRTDTLTYKVVDETIASHSIQQKKDRQNTAFNTLILFTDIAYKVSMFMSIVMMAATLASGIYAVMVFALQKPVAGYTTMMLVITGSFFGVFAILAIIIKYLSVLIDLVFRKQKYLIESIEKITQ